MFIIIHIHCIDGLKPLSVDAQRSGQFILMERLFQTQRLLNKRCG